MAIELSRLIRKVEHMDITLLGGEAGLHNLVSWFLMVESVEAAEFLNDGDIVFTTGLGLTKDFQLSDLIKSIEPRNPSGIIVNTGPFIEQVPQNAIDYCNQISLPIFMVPWKIHLAEIIRIFCFCITKDEQKELQAAAAFKNAILFPDQKELYTTALSQQNFQNDWQYAACVMEIGGVKNNLSRSIEGLTAFLRNSILHTYKDCTIFSNQTEIIAIAANYTENELYAFSEDLRTYALRYLSPGETIFFGVGRLTKSIRCLYKSYQQAKAIEQLQAKDKIPNTMFFFSHMGLYRLLIGIEDQAIIRDYFDNTLGPLFDYDTANNSDLTTVLHTYLQNNGSVKDTAAELFVHRNTVNYKLNKISDLLSLDLSSLDVRMQLMIAFMLKDIL